MDLNGTSEFEWTTDKLVLLPVTALLVFIALVGNGLVIISWALHSYLRTPSNSLLLSLSVTDFLIAIFAVSLTLQDQIVGSWKLGGPMCFVWLFSNFGVTFVSSFHLVLIAVDRYRILFQGVSYLQSRTIKSSLIPVLYVWLYAIALMSPMYLDWEGTVHYGKHQKLPGQLKCQSRRISSWRLLMILNFIGLPSTALVILYYKIYTELKRRFRKSIASYKPGAETVAIELSSNGSGIGELPSGSSVIEDVRSRKTEIATEKERKAARTLGFLVFAFLVCWIPYFCVTLVSIVYPDIDKTYFHFARIMGAVNSGINPLIYAISSEDFRRGFKHTFTACFRQ